MEAASRDGEVFILFTVRDGRITRMRDFRDRATALAAARPSTPRPEDTASDAPASTT